MTTCTADVMSLHDLEDLWKFQLKQIKGMRKVPDAPVDTMGCHMLADRQAPPEVFRFQVLLSLMLSSQTKDQVTAAAMERLKKHGCTIESILAISKADLETMLCPVGFYRRKAEHIQKAAKLLQDQFKGDVPDTVEGLCSLPGVGPKMAHLVMQTAWDKTEGIAVDTHVHRIVNRLNWVKTKTPEQTRTALQNKLPREEWSTINKLLVGFGQQICLPVGPKCDVCQCSTFCPSATRSITKTETTVKKRSADVLTLGPDIKSNLSKEAQAQLTHCGTIYLSDFAAAYQKQQQQQPEVEEKEVKWTKKDLKIEESDAFPQKSIKKEPESDEMPLVTIKKRRVKISQVSEGLRRSTRNK